MIVLDASAAVDWLEWREPVASQVEQRLLAADGVHVPHLWLVEVAQVLRRHVLAGALAADRGLAALRAADELAAARHPHEPLAERVWQLRANLSAYDAVYVALAEALGATLVTSDARLAGAPGTTATVDVLG